METLIKKSIRQERDGDLAFVILDNPPFNRLDAKLRLSLVNALNAAVEDPQVRIVIIAASGQHFSEGIDVHEREEPTPRTRDAVSLAQLCLHVENLSKPVVAALHGNVFGGGLELALAAHYRVAAPGARFAMPDIKMGVIPNGGATQRLTRLVGPDAALQILLSGTAIKTKQALEIKLLDSVDELAVVHDVHAATDSRAAARDFASDELPIRKTSRLNGYLRDVEAFTSVIADHQLQVEDYYHRSVAAEAIVRCVEAAILLPFPAGLEMEQNAFAERAASHEAQALRYARFAHEAARNIPHIDELGVSPLSRFGVYGTSPAGIALVCDILAKGHWVSLAAYDSAGMKTALGAIGDNLKTCIVAGEMTDRQAAKALGLLKLTSNINDLSECDLVMEALEDHDKVRGLRQLHAMMDKSAILATDMRGGDFAQLEKASGRGAAFVGLRGRLVMKGTSLVEVVVGDKTNAETIAAAHDFLREIGKTPICTRFVVSQRLEGAMRMAANRLVLMGASPGQVDASMRLFGLTYGPFQLADLQGIDSLALPQILGDPVVSPMIARGWTGQRAKLGYYRYEGGTVPLGSNRDLAPVIEAARKDRGLTQRKFHDGAIRDRMVMALINEAAAIVEAQVVIRPSDIDVIAVQGFGYPKHRGGILLEADRAGLVDVVQKIEEFAHEDPEFWSVHPLLRRMADARASFIDLDKI